MGLINIFKIISTFFKPAPLINLSNIDNFFSDKLLRRQGIKPRAAGSVSKDANHFAALPPKPILL